MPINADGGGPRLTASDFTLAPTSQQSYYSTQRRKPSQAVDDMVRKLLGKGLGNYDYIRNDFACFQGRYRLFHFSKATYPAQGLQHRSDAEKFRPIDFA
jgi:hypothetical protein